jgi:serine/threonine-protein kinase
VTSPPLWERVKEVFQAALEREPHDRAAFVRGTCGEDAALQAEVESLLVAHEQAGSFGARPAILSLDVPTETEDRVLHPGERLGPFEVTAFLAAGGMGEVYVARDTRLERDVAIKTLPRFVAADPKRLARLEREARALAALNHPNIAAIHGLEEKDGVIALVLELVEGFTLASRLERGPLPISEALSIARQIADALDAAHEKGFVHRDLKPANIQITPAGVVKVLDFGLATLSRVASSDSGSENSAGKTPHVPSIEGSRDGIVRGTAAYMSPEQARGHAVDRRADIWAFGCVVYELLSGKRAFPGDTISDTLAAVVERQPDWQALPSATPAYVVRLLRRCLEKDSKARLRDIADARIDLAYDVDGESGPMASPHEGTRGWRRALPLAVAAGVGGLIVGIGAWLVTSLGPRDQRMISRFEYEVPENLDFRNADRPIIAFAPDGSQFVYNTIEGLYLRSLRDPNARLIPGTEEDLSNPFFSPDGQWVGYFSRGQLKKIAARGGTATSLCKADDPFGASWGSDGTIVYAESGGIKRVSANGGTPVWIVRAEANEQVYGPQVLPGGEWLLFTVTRARGAHRWDQAEVVVQSLNSGERKVLFTGGSDARYVSTGHLVYAAENVVLARAFSLNGLNLSGGPVPVITGVQRTVRPDLNTGFASYSFSNSGTLVYVHEAEVPRNRVLALIDRKGGMQRLDVPPAPYVNPRLSPDARQLAVQTLEDDGRSEIWVYNLSGQTQIRQLTAAGNSSRPLWAPDGTRVTFDSDRDKGRSIYWQSADGSGVPERLTIAEEGTSHHARSWSAHGPTLSFTVEADGNTGIWTVVPGRGNKPEPFYDIPASKQDESAFSPDGKWLAYTSDESGRQEIHVQPFPATGRKHQLTQEGGTFALWSPDGREIFYRRTFQQVTRSQGMRLFAVPIQTDGRFEFGNERTLPLDRFLAFRGYQDYDITPDGQRFLMVVLPEGGEARSPRIHIVQNWFEDLQERVPLR